jgi:hypothetical protein
MAIAMNSPVMICKGERNMKLVLITTLFISSNAHKIKSITGINYY